MAFELKFNIGDTIVDDKPESVLYRRDCIVVYADPTFVGVVTEGIPRISFVDADEQGIRRIKEGMGRLLDIHHEQITKIVSTWPDAAFLRKIPQDMDAALKSGGYDPNVRVPITVTGYIAKPLALQWRRYLALIFIAKEHSVDLPPDVESRLLEWMFMSTIPNIPSIHLVRRFMEGQGGQGEQGGQSS